MRPISTTLVVIVAVLAATTAWFWRSLEVERQRSSELLSRVAELEQRTTTSTPGESTAAASPAPVAQPTAESLPSSASPLPNVPDAIIEEQRRLSDPSYRAAAGRLYRAEYSKRKPDLMRALRITAEQADHILDYWASRDVITQDYSLQTAASTNMQQIDAVNERKKQVMVAEEQQLRATVGDAIVEHLREFDASMQSRYQVDSLRELAARAGTPLRDEQIEPLVTLFHAEEKRLESEAEAFQSTIDMSSGDPRRNYFRLQKRRLELATERNERLQYAARDVLSETQVRQLDEHLEQQLESDRARTSLMEIQAAQPADTKVAKD